MKYHLIFLTHLKKILGFRQLYLLKHLELLRDEMRNIYITFTNFFQKDFFSITHHEEEFDSLLKKLIEFYSFSNIISKDVLSQISVLLIFFDLNIKKVDIKK